MFTPSQITRVARAAHTLTLGSGGGHTEYAHKGRYVVGGVHTRIYPIGESVARIRQDVRNVGPMGMVAQTLGCWEHDGSVYVDFGTVTDSLTHALALAVGRGELAIYDSKTGHCIPTPSGKCQNFVACEEGCTCP